ncbi:MAG: hypothetical protein M3N47_07935 [Chloroflexota bacterium]|nr:hypothetical protein [Chloroflexota bacterium]
MTSCERIKQQLDAAIEVRKDIVAEMRDPNLSAAERAQLLREFKGIGPVIADLRRRYEQCITPPTPKPDLVAHDFSVTRQGSTISMRGVIRNDGDVPASGPFKIVLGVQSSASFRELTVQVPSSTTIEAGASYITPEAIANIPRTAVRFFMLVDSDHEVSETLESNNSKQKDWSPATTTAGAGNGTPAPATQTVAQPR